jgi:hypothetical protein
MCGTNYLFPEKQTFMKALVNDFDSIITIANITDKLKKSGVNIKAFDASVFYLPSYPAYKICVEYENNCRDYINNDIGIKTITPNCSTVKNGVQSYPMTSQTVFKLKFFENFSVRFDSSPNLMVELEGQREGTYQMSCPEGTVIPDDPGNPRNRMVPGTGCAYTCRSPLYTTEEKENIDSTVLICSAVSFPFIMAVLLTWGCDAEKRKKGYLILVFTIFSAITTSWFLVMAIAKSSMGGDYTKVFCLNNAMELRQADGISLCVVQGYVLQFCGMTCQLTWMVQSIDLFLRLCLYKKDYNHFYYHMFFIFGISSTFTIYGAVNGVCVYDYICMIHVL